MFAAPIRPSASARADRDMPSAERIAVVVAEFSTGGSERVAIRLANLWAATGRAVTIFCGSENGPTRPLVGDDVAVRAILPRHGAGRPSRRALGRALADQLRDGGYDAIVGPGNYHVPLLDALARAMPKARPAIVCKISNPLIRADRSGWKQLLFLANLRRTTHQFDRLVAMSPGLQAEARTVLHRADIACAAEPTLAAGKIAADRPVRGALPGLILCVGRLAAQKNFTLALEAFARAAPEHRMVILGEGEDREALSARAAALGIAHRVEFAGFVTDVAPWLARADVLLSTSRFEGYPAALVEALAARVPVVTTPCTLALPDIMLDASFGAVVAADPDALAAALNQVLVEGRRPAAAPLETLAHRHHDVEAATAWLTILDRVVGEREASNAAIRFRGPKPIAIAAPASDPAVA